MPRFELVKIVSFVELECPSCGLGWMEELSKMESEVFAIEQRLTFSAACDGCGDSGFVTIGGEEKPRTHGVLKINNL